MPSWTLDDCETIAAVLGHVLETHSGLHCKGASRALKPPSERWVRVVATAYKMELSYVKGKGSDRMYLNFLYTLADEDGELHPPKMPDRREIELTWLQQLKIRTRIQMDVYAMASATGLTGRCGARLAAEPTGWRVVTSPWRCKTATTRS